MKVNLHIERLILDGVPIARSQGALVQAAVETELARLIVAEGLAPSLISGGVMPDVRGGAIQLASVSDPGHLGTQIAQAVYGGLGNE